MIKNKYFIKTQGCQMNEYDSDKISDLLMHHYQMNQTENFGCWHTNIKLVQ